MPGFALSENVPCHSGQTSVPTHEPVKGLTAPLIIGTIVSGGPGLGAGMGRCAAHKSGSEPQFDGLPAGEGIATVPGQSSAGCSAQSVHEVLQRQGSGSQGTPSP